MTFLVTVKKCFGVACFFNFHLARFSILSTLARLQIQCEKNLAVITALSSSGFLQVFRWLIDK